MFKPHPLEFLQTEFDELAAEVGKLATEVEFEITEFVKDNVLGRKLSIKGAAPVAKEPVAPAAEPVAETAAVPAEAPVAEAQTELPI